MGQDDVYTVKTFKVGLLLYFTAELKKILKHFFTVTPTCFGPNVPKHVEVTVKKCFKVNFNN